MTETEKLKIVIAENKRLKNKLERMTRTHKAVISRIEGVLLGTEVL